MVVRFFLLACLCGFSEARAVVQASGLPLVRSYPLEEIGNATRAASLCFDAHGRLAIISDGAISVLNDTVWAEIAQPRDATTPSIAIIGADRQGRQYYGGLGGWGMLEMSPEGRATPVSLVPAQAPAWIRNTTFNRCLQTANGLCFYGWNGLALLDSGGGPARLIELGPIGCAFMLQGQVYVCLVRGTVVRVDPASGMVTQLDRVKLSRQGALAAELDERRVLLLLGDGRMVVFDGEQATPWTGLERHGLRGTVTALLRLADGNIAVAITGKGVFLLTESGDLVSAITSPQYHRIAVLAAREPGVLWLLAEDAVEKVLYGNPLASFGQRLGLPLSWPLLAIWEGRVMVATEGRLYETLSPDGVTPSRFELSRTQLPGGTWSMSAHGETLFLGNAGGVSVVERDGELRSLLRRFEVSHLAVTPGGLCYVVGPREIAVLRRQDGAWSECAPRIANNGAVSVVTVARESLWLEYGADQVGRVALDGGGLSLQVLRDPSWAGVPWVNVGCVGDLVVLSAAPRGRMYFDERTRSRCEAPELERLLASSPHEIVRVLADASGVLWGTHRQGVVVFRPAEGGHSIDTETYGDLPDLYPRIHALGEGDIWISGPRSLYHVQARAPGFGPRSAPVLVSINSLRLGGGPGLPGAAAGPVRLSPDRNTLSLSFFSGSYAWLRPPKFRYRLNGEGEWGLLDFGSALTLSGLREGSYRLEVQQASSGPAPEGAAAAEQTTVFDFEVLPPWHRTRVALLLYALAAAGLVFGLVRWTGALARRRNRLLEDLVQRRTAELGATMEKLNEETRTAATLAERNRLAAEIHDSLQQGLCGAILQLDATISHPVSQGPLRERLSTVRNMVSYARNEVQNAVWDLESPILVGTDLGTALGRLTALLNPGTVAVELAVEGEPVPLRTDVQHHLLRITQEALANAVKHASARRVRIGLRFGAETVSLSVADDGAGFNPEAAPDGGVARFGLRGMRERARRIGAELRLESGPGSGTTVSLALPLAAARARQADPQPPITG